MQKIARETIVAKEAAAMLGVSEWVVYDWARKKLIPHIKVGKRVLFRRASIMQWLSEQEQASVAAEPVKQGKIRRLK